MSMISFAATPNVPRVKRRTVTVTRTFDDNENLIEERTETDEEFEYFSQHYLTNNTNTF